MTMLRTALAALLILPAIAWADPGEVVGVIDGDTVDVLSPDRKMTRCRLYGIDAPEKGQPVGQAAKKALSDLTYRKTLDVRVVDTDRYGRAICRLTLAGVDINREQVGRGMAWVYRRYNREPALYEVETAARAALGLPARPLRRALSAPKGDTAHQIYGYRRRKWTASSSRSRADGAGSAAIAAWPSHESRRGSCDRPAAKCHQPTKSPLPSWSGAFAVLALAPRLEGRLTLCRAAATIPQAVMDVVVERHRLAATIRATLVPFQPLLQRRRPLLPLLLLSPGALRVVGQLMRFRREAPEAAVDLHAIHFPVEDARRSLVVPLD